MKNLDLNIFPQTDKDQWLQLAEKQLKGASPEEKLAWQNDAGIELQGYYDKSDLKELDYLTEFFSSVKPHRWKLYENIKTDDPKLANTNALEALTGGCDGIILENPRIENLNSILSEVNHEICDVNISSSDRLESDSRFTGFLMYEGGNCVGPLEQNNPIDQIVFLLSKIDTEPYVYRNAFTDFYLEISTLRSIKYLLERKGHAEIHIHTHIPLHQSDEHQWFLNTTSGLASILGGSHSVDFSTASGDSRISRNTGNLIREESGIITWSDQCGGSFYVEALTDKIIKKVSEKLN